jgi:hypothetical protein
MTHLFLQRFPPTMARIDRYFHPVGAKRGDKRLNAIRTTLRTALREAAQIC